jgi:hypothetical protein
VSEANESDTVSAANESDTVSEANESDTVSEANESDTVSAANESDTVSEDETPVAPMITVVKGDPTPEEIAAVVVAIASLQAAGADRPAPRVSQWSAYWRSLRAPVAPGPGSWRQSARSG